MSGCAPSWPERVPTRMSVPIIDIAPLFGVPGKARDDTDRAILAAAHEIGFLNIVGLPPDVPLGAQSRSDLLRIFALDRSAQRRLWRQKFAPENANVYRGWFPLQPGNVTAKEGIDLGADVLHGCDVICSGDPLREATPLPMEASLPGWRAAIARYYAAMERVCKALMHSIARSLQLPEDFFDAAFHRGLSTLRLLRYPPRTAQELAACSEPAVWVEHEGRRSHLAGAPHTDSGFVTVLAQDGVGGLQARNAQGRWIEAPPLERALVVNFGQVLERWCGGRIRATEHRVVGSQRERFSIPFFYEARADATIAPLPIDAADSFAPFLFGDYLWERIVRFVEFRGMQSLRQPTRR
jgi:isopenicillin N synthase-like dioxygenase